MGDDIDAYEYAVLVTNMDTEIMTLGSHYRYRADSENNFDELKNQWGIIIFTRVKNSQVLSDKRD